MCVEFPRTYKGTLNDMSPMTVDFLALGTNGNMQSGIRCYSLSTGHVFQRKWRDAEVTQKPMSEIS